MRCCSRVALRVSLLLVLALQGRGPVLAQSTFLLGFSPTRDAHCDLQRPSVGVDCTLSSDGGGRGAEGWTIALKASNARITGITVARTEAEVALQKGFVMNEITTGPGNEGAVSIVALSLDQPFTLQGGRHTIATLDVEWTDQGKLEYVEGLRSSAGTVGNAVLEDNQARVPRIESLEKLVPGSPFWLGFAAESLETTSLFEGLLGGAEGVGEIDAAVAPGQEGMAHVFPSIVSSVQGSGAQGWALSVELGGEVEIASATTAGTIVERRLSQGFMRTDVVDPRFNDGRRGVVSAVVLSFVQRIELPPVGTFSVLDIGLKRDISKCGQDCAGELQFRDGLKGAGQPVMNILTFEGNSVFPCGTSTASATVRFRETKEVFRRGNANGDERVDLFDVIFLFSELFGGGPVGSCREAEDSNGSGRIDISDPVFLFHYIFLQGRAPPPPFPVCGVDPDGAQDGLDCGEAEPSC